MKKKNDECPFEPLLSRRVGENPSPTKAELDKEQMAEKSTQHLFPSALLRFVDQSGNLLAC